MLGESMVNILPTVLYSLMIGMTLLALLDVCKRTNNRQNLFFGGLLVLLLVHLSGELFIYSGAYVYAPWLAGAQFPFRVLLGPALFFYAHATMSPEKRIDKRILTLALTGPVLVILVMLPFMFLISPEQKLALATPETRDPELWKIALLTCLITTVIFISFTLVYLVMAFRLHQAHVQQLMERFSEIEQRSLLWFKQILVVWGVVWSLYAIEFSLGALGWRWFGTGIVLPVLEVVALSIFIQSALSQKVLSEAEKGTPRIHQQRTSIVNAQKAEQIVAKLEQVMTQEKLFLEDNLSLNKLSESISETENHISETLSQFLNTNFFQYVNGFRIEQAKQALMDKNKLVTTVAYDVGFNSKSTFNTAFKKVVGCTPTAYRKLKLEQ